MSNSMAASEAFHLLNAGTRQEYRGWGDTQTAARDRAAKKAGLTPAQAERLWKHWRTMRSPNGDVYRGLRNTYGHLCRWVENAAERFDRKATEIEDGNASMARNRGAVQGALATDEGRATTRSELKGE